MSTFSTRNRMYFLTLDGKQEDELLVDEMHGEEGVSQLFQLRLKLLSSESHFAPDEIIGKSAILRIETWDTGHSGGERHWSGYVSRFAVTGCIPATHDKSGDLFCYECDIVPWFWFMTQNEDCRIFQNLTVADIIDTVFAEFGYSDYKLELSKSYPRLEYCTQFNESTYAFLCRLIEREGIYFYFRHDESSEARHILVFSDNKDHNPRLEPFQVPFHHEGHAEGTDAVRKLSSTQQVRTRAATLADWDYVKRAPLSENTPTLVSAGSDLGLEIYRYPGGFTPASGAADASVGKHLTNVLMESQESSHLLFHGEGQVRSLTPGHLFELENHSLIESFNAVYMVVSVQHHARNNLMLPDSTAWYGNTFTLQSKDAIYRPAQVTPRGRVHGPQTAIVTGPAGNEVHTDDLGRIKVRFHWDRKVASRKTNTQDDKSSCWVRVAQLWAGAGYGTFFLPRVGMEVVVDFLDGDPDRPLVVGCVYNGPNPPPVAPADATRSTIKTLSSKGGGGFNELRFEDKKGSEEIFLHAQKDLQLRTGNCRTEAIGTSADLSIGKDRTESIGENAQLTIGQAQTISIGTSRAVTAGVDDYLTVGANQHTDVGANIAVTAGANYDLTAGINSAVTAGVNIDMKAGVNLVAEAGVVISLKAGSNSIVLNPAGVFITGNLVMINSGGSPLSAQKAQKAEKADKPSKAKDAIQSKAGKVSNPAQQLQAQALRNAARSAQPFCAECEAARAALEALG
ncbi:MULTISPECIES: type VI secretion system Vgr family protein [Thermomonas]|jgi:type VI secretion system secreted protein VgrG|uniref:type VI secretion system Vgr family protein n=1 Tax=Thermomonas TaxID=141948 RepID=UPI00040F75D4|nr:MULTISPECIES: type VI secretion system tip protein TssI/VgrG [Thermomonas]MBH2010840.1 type VI secretion system tip protein VgrG [Xanthomonadaceae bacterium]